jgi:chromosome segregation ATPase
MVTEHLFFKSGGNEMQLNLYKDTAAEYVRRRLAEENVQTQAFLLEENDKLKQQIEELEETIKQYEEQIAQYAKREQQYKKALLQAKTNIEEVVKQYRYLAQWTVKLMDELHSKYSRFRTTML